MNTTVPGTFQVKRRWDDGAFLFLSLALDMCVFAEGMELGIDLIFKNQAMTPKDKGQGHFVNDLLRTEFHKSVSFVLFSFLFVLTSHEQKIHGQIYQGIPHGILFHWTSTNNFHNSNDTFCIIILSQQCILHVIPSKPHDEVMLSI